MTATRIAALALGTTGALALVGALCWWWLSYGEVYHYDYLSLGQAGLCLVGDSEICRLATSLCRGRHTIAVAPYSSAALWLALGVLFTSMMIPGRRPLTSEPRSGMPS